MSAMTFQTPDPLASGKPYPVVDVEGAAPRSLGQFAGETEFGIEHGGAVSWIKGFGTGQRGGIRFHEKDVDHSGKDVRVWVVREDSAGRITAETLSIF